MSREAAFLGIPSRFNNSFQIYPPTVKQVVENPGYFVHVSLLTQTQGDIEDQFEKLGQTDNFLTPLEFLLFQVSSSQEIEKLVRQAFEFFTQEEIVFNLEQKAITVGRMDLNNPFAHILIEANFHDFQNAIRIAVGRQPKTPETPLNPNDDPRVLALKRRFRKAERQKERGEFSKHKGLTLATILGALCLMETGLNPLTVGSISYAAAEQLRLQYQEKESYHMQMRTLTSGFSTSKKVPEYWVKDHSKK